MRTIRTEGPWVRLHRAESDVLGSLLSTEERSAVLRRLGLPSGPPAAWVPPSSGGEGGRFAEPHGPGASYLGADLETCIAEVIHHHERRCLASVGTPPGTRAVLRHLVFKVAGAMADAASMRGAVHHLTDDGPSWTYGRLARGAGLDGVHFRSVRRPGSLCLAVFAERAAASARVESGAVVLEWDGKAAHRVA